MATRPLTALLNALKDCPHPTWQSRESKNRVYSFLFSEKKRRNVCVLLNVGSASRRLSAGCINIDFLLADEVDVRGDLLALPVKSGSVHAVVCTGVLEHVRDARQAVKEIHRILKNRGRAFIETPFIQTVHASPADYYRWTTDGLRQLMSDFHVHEINITAGPATALAWNFQQTMAMLFSLNSLFLYKLGLRFFGWIAIPISWMDVLLERHAMASQAASGFSIIVEKVENHQKQRTI